MTNTIKLITKATLLSLILSGGVAFAAPGDPVLEGDDTTLKNLTLDKGRLYQTDGFVDGQWALDVGSDGLWFVPKDDMAGTYSAPLKVRHDAASNTLVIGTNDDTNVTNGYVGIGTDSPEAKLDVRYNGENTAGDGLTNLMVLEATNTNATLTSDTGFALKNGRSGKQWNFRTTDDGTGFAATINGTGGTEFKIINNTANISGTNLYLGSGATCVNGVWTNRSSRTSKENIQPLSSKEALEAFSQLQPMTYNYKSDKSEKYVGFIAEDVPDLVAINSRDGLSAMDMVALLTKVVQEQEKKIQRLEAMQKRLTRVESLLTNLALDTSKKTKEKVTINK